MAKRKHGVREVRSGVPIEEMMTHVGKGVRLEILRVLSESAKCVTAIANALFHKLPVVSRDLADLEELGLVTHDADKNQRIYRLTDRVHAQRCGEKVQLAIDTDHGHWFFVHLEDGAPDTVVKPPGVFIDSKVIEAAQRAARRGSKK